MRTFLLAILCCATSAHAQFNLDRLNINKLLDTTKNVVKATTDIAEPEEIAAAVLFLSSPASSYVTGSVMGVNGGYVMN